MLRTNDVWNWTASLVGSGARAIAARRLIGGVASSVHCITVRDARGRRSRLVVRRYPGADQRDFGAHTVTREAAVLAALERSSLSAPRLVDADPDGTRTGVPTLVMSCVPGIIQLRPTDPESWLRQMAAMLPRIHELTIPADPFEHWFDASQVAPPPQTRDASMWRRAIDLVSIQPPAHIPRFIHRDYQHFNLLWSRGKLTGIVDWCFASNGPPDVDVAHCRLNLAVLFSASWAERFRLAYEAEAGRATDPWWDVAGLMSYSQDWKEFIPRQVGNRMQVDVAGMDGRMDEILALALKRADAGNP
jgi:aminoglycoside phosphotransferase (APT) family kinase protein